MNPLTDEEIDRILDGRYIRAVTVDPYHISNNPQPDAGPTSGSNAPQGASSTGEGPPEEPRDDGAARGGGAGGFESRCRPLWKPDCHGDQPCGCAETERRRCGWTCRTEPEPSLVKARHATWTRPACRQEWARHPSTGIRLYGLCGTNGKRHVSCRLHADGNSRFGWDRPGRVLLCARFAYTHEKVDLTTVFEDAAIPIAITYESFKKAF